MVYTAMEHLDNFEFTDQNVGAQVSVSDDGDVYLPQEHHDKPDGHFANAKVKMLVGLGLGLVGWMCSLEEKKYGAMMKRDGFDRVMKGGSPGFLQAMRGGDEGDEEPNLQVLKKEAGTSNYHYIPAPEDMDPKKLSIPAVKRGQYAVRMARSKSKNYIFRAARGHSFSRMARGLQGEEFYYRLA